MSMKFIFEHASAAVLALELAKKESEHLHYSQSTLFAMPIDLTWVKSLGTQPHLAEKVEAFVSRFGRLQDHLGEKLFPRFAALVGESNKTLLDSLATAERMDMLPSADAFIAARKLRNALVHEYMHDSELFLESLFAARDACDMFFGIVKKADAELRRLGVQPKP
jgi:hypothetical protein